LLIILWALAAVARASRAAVAVALVGCFPDLVCRLHQTPLTLSLLAVEEPLGQAGMLQQAALTRPFLEPGLQPSPLRVAVRAAMRVITTQQPVARVVVDLL
jgi:hypothetical protein